jgi:uncharacterized protein YbjT (DUF2867 family)
MGKVVNLIGASGLVGHQLVVQLLENHKIEKLRIFVRRRTGIVHPKLEELVIDFDKPESWTHLVKGDLLFSSLGTTIKTAKTKENQYKVDFTYQYNFAKAAADNGVPVYVLVSSMGANAKSTVFYSRMKGEMDEEVTKLKFKKLLIFRPSILDGDRQEKRIAEKIGLVISRFLTRFVLKRYKPTPVDRLADKMIRSSLDETSGLRVIEGIEILQDQK